MTNTLLDKTTTFTSAMDKEFSAFVEANLKSCVAAIAHLHTRGVLPAGPLRLQLRDMESKQIPNLLTYAESVVARILIARIAGGEYLLTMAIDTAPMDGTVVVVNDTTGMTQWCEAKYVDGDHWKGWAYADEVCNDTNPGGPLLTRWIPSKTE